MAIEFSRSPSSSGAPDQLVSYRVKECCVQLHTSVQKWKELSAKGFDIVSQVVNATMGLKYTQDPSLYGTLTHSTPDVSSRLQSKEIAKREDLFQQLKETKDKLLEVVDKMGSLVRNLRNAVDLVLIKSQSLQHPLFNTLPPASFAAYSEQLFLAYSQEMSMRESIVGDLFTQTNRDTLTIYLSCWLHEPYITHTVNEHLEAMLFDCGLRP